MKEGGLRVIKAGGGIVSKDKWVVWLVFLWTVCPLHTFTRQATITKEVTLNVTGARNVALKAAKTMEVAVKIPRAIELAVNRRRTRRVRLHADRTRKVALKTLKTREVTKNASRIREVALSGPGTKRLSLNAPQTREVTAVNTAVDRGTCCSYTLTPGCMQGVLVATDCYMFPRQYRPKRKLDVRQYMSIKRRLMVLDIGTTTTATANLQVLEPISSQQCTLHGHW